MRRFAVIATVLAAGMGVWLASLTSPPTPPRHGEEEVTLAAVGDVLLARGVGQQIAGHGADYPFAETTDIVSSADLAFCNLECTLSRRGLPQRWKYRFRADPSLARMLRSNGFDVICLANNHTLDYGREALLDTRAAVENAGLVAVGAGKNRREALQVRVVTRNGLRVGFAAYTDLLGSGVVRLDDRPTVAGANIDEIPRQMRSAKAGCDVLVVSFHWGVEYMRRPTERQRKLAHLCIDHGADLILGHHPHVPQTIETYKAKPIVYSMGGFVWDSKVFGSNKSAIHLFTLGRSSARLDRSIPLTITNCRPTPDP